MRFWCAGCLLWLVALPSLVTAAEQQVTIRSDFPGGNVLVERNEGETVHLAPDLRGGKPWFYWHFEAEASRPGRVLFIFDSGARVGVRGPAISRDAGLTWQWLGAEHVRYNVAADAENPKRLHDEFTYEFSTAGEKVRFAVAIPYLQRDLDAFLEKHSGNPHLRVSELAKSLNGRTVELLQIGEPGPEVEAMLITARHHACESMASYVLEGFLQEAVSDSPAAKEFRKRYVLFAVPIVDKDGVQQGDQGKWRSPHDHNRDYGQINRYPEVRAIQELAEAHQVRLALDLHCPALRGDVHEAFYFDGLALPHIRRNINELIEWLKEERPPASSWPLNFMKKPPILPPINGMPFSHYFAYRDRIRVAATLEVPYTQPTRPLDAAVARAYGAGLLRAWVRTRFLAADEEATSADDQHARLVELRKEFQRTYRGKPQEAEQMIAPYLNTSAATIFQIEAHALLAQLRLQQRRYAEALEHAKQVQSHPEASAQQRATALIQQVQIVCADPDSTQQAVDASLAKFAELSHPAPEQQAHVYETAGDYSIRQQDFARALHFAEQQFVVAAKHDKGKVLNRIAGIYDRLGQPEKGIEARQKAVELLRPQLDPAPVSIFGARMLVDHFEALAGIPTTPPDELREAGERVLEHRVMPAAWKDQVRATLAEAGGKSP